VSWGAHWGLSTFTGVWACSLGSQNLHWGPGVLTGVSEPSLGSWGGNTASRLALGTPANPATSSLAQDFPAVA